MAKIRNSRPKNPSGGFNRLFDDEALGFLMSKVQSTVIANGSELEKVITELAPTVENLDSVLENPGLFPDGTYLVPKKQIKKSTICHIHTIDASGEKVKLPEPDFFILELDGGRNFCYVLELKDGHVFDTKKSQAEKDGLVKFTQQLGARIPYITRHFICCFNQDDVKEIRKGLKNVFQEEEILTGRQFCEKLSIDYQMILRTREEDAKDNVDFFFEELGKLEITKKYFVPKL